MIRTPAVQWIGISNRRAAARGSCGWDRKDMTRMEEAQLGGDRWPTVACKRGAAENDIICRHNDKQHANSKTDDGHYEAAQELRC